MSERYRISPIGARGQHDSTNHFAYRYAGRVCYLIGYPRWESFDRDEGMRQEVQLADTGETGHVWEDELESVCPGREECGGCWECDPTP